MGQQGARRACTLVSRGLSVVLLALGLSNAARAEEIRVTGTGAALESLRLLGQEWSKSRTGDKVTVLGSLGSGGGIKAVVAGTVDLAVSSRPLKEAEAARGASQIEYARTPFVFAVHRGSKVDSITTRGLADMYAGKVSRWPDGTRIRLVLRPAGDTDSEAIREIAPEVRAAYVVAQQRKGMIFAGSDQEAADGLEKIPGAFGSSTLALILSEKRTLKALRFNNVEPSVRNLESGNYPLHKTLYLITGPRSSAAARQFVAFVQSPRGREILLRTGHAVK